MLLTRRACFPLAALLVRRHAWAQGGFRARLVTANDTAATLALQTIAMPSRLSIRRVAEALRPVAAAFASKDSRYFRSSQLIAPMAQAAELLRRAQHSDGTIDAGNLHSPPDTGFLVEFAGEVLAVLRRQDDQRLNGVRETLDQFLLAAGEALITGGIHTPNHRWVICSGLAWLHSLFPDTKYRTRIDEWLAEGVDIDADGQFSERSTAIYGRVTDAALVTMARLLNRPALLEPVRRNLEMLVYYLHPDGEVETVGSRRQDAGMVAASAGGYYREYRYLAIRDGNPRFAAVARLLEEHQAGAIERTTPLLSFLADPLLERTMPSGAGLPGDYARVFPVSHVARIRRGAISATVFGGSDWPRGVESGLSSTPSFFTFRKGRAVLESLRMGAAFFSQGAFHPEGLTVTHDRKYVLRQTLTAPYYQPLAKQYRKPGGDYPLTPARDERFWSKLDFPHRRESQVQTLQQRVTISERDGTFELAIEVTGATGVPVTLEFAFRTGGILEGKLRGKILEEGTGFYRLGPDAIEFGPGEAAHELLDLSGHSYRAHGATLTPVGERVYVMGLTPFRKTLTIRGI